MDQVTQHDAAMVRQPMAASENISRAAKELFRLVTRFRVDRENAGPMQQRRLQKLSHSTITPGPGRRRLRRNALSIFHNAVGTALEKAGTEVSGHF